MSATERRPSFPFYGREFYSSPRIRCLTAAQRAVWLALAWRCWEEGMLEDGTAMLELTAASEGVSVEDVRRVLTLCFELKEGSWRNPKLEEIRSELDSFRAAQAARGLKGADARWRKHGDAMAPPSASNGTPMALDGSVSVSGSVSVKKKSSPRSASAGEPSIPTRILTDAFNESFERRFKSKYAFVGKRDGKIVQDILGLAGGDPEAVLARLRFAEADSYHADRLRDWPYFLGAWNKLVPAHAPSVGRVNGKPWDERRALERLRSDDPRIVKLGADELRAHGIDPDAYRAVAQ